MGVLESGIRFQVGGAMNPRRSSSDAAQEPNAPWDESYDVVVVGSGAAGLTTAITAARQGLSCVVLESASVWGGSSAISGGGVWIPNNHLMAAEGDPDSLDEARRYLKATVRDEGRSTSAARVEAFLAEAPKMARFLESLGFRWSRASNYPDYYPELPGARRGRIIESVQFDGRAIGKEIQRLRGGGRKFTASTRDMFYLSLMFRTLAGFSRTAKVVTRAYLWRLFGKIPLSPGGRALVCQLIFLAQKQSKNIVMKLETPLRKVVMNGRRTAGVIAEHKGAKLRIEARHAVVLCSGGFAHNSALRESHQGIGVQWTAAPPDDKGDAISIAAEIGAGLESLKYASWAPVVLYPGDVRGIIMWERTLPGSIIVDASGERFVNEGGSYVDVGHAMLERNKHAPAIPSWLILDGKHRRRYLFGANAPGYTPQSLIDHGLIVPFESLEQLAAKCGIDPNGLLRTVKRFNLFAKSGIDEDFGRGISDYEKYIGADPRVRPNSNLGPISTAPFWAIPLYPGDIGTKGGMVCDERSRVLGTDGTPFVALYASGNATASIMGGAYPGPGITLGPAMTFGFIAANDIAQRASHPVDQGQSTVAC